MRNAFWLLLILLGFALPGFTQASNVSAKANAGPSVNLAWQGPTCAMAVTLNTASPPAETSGPCSFAVLRCMGSSCGSATLPALPGTNTPIAAGPLGTGNTWQALTQTGAQTSLAGMYLDESGLVYGGLYNYAVLLTYQPGTPYWSAYSNIATLTIPPDTFSIPTDVVATLAGKVGSYHAALTWTGCAGCRYLIGALAVSPGTMACPVTTYPQLNRSNPATGTTYSDYANATKTMCYRVQAMLNGKYSSNSQPTVPLAIPSNK
jgi:hypothetical protein